MGNMAVNILPIYKYIFDHSSQYIVGLIPKPFYHTSLCIGCCPCLEALFFLIPLANCSHPSKLMALLLLWEGFWNLRLKDGIFPSIVCIFIMFKNYLFIYLSIYLHLLSQVA
jgi:hypothetical protein